MMYNQKLVFCVKSSGKILREFKDQVFIPFGAEYSLLIKNLNTVRALVHVTIDGSDIADGQAFVVNANSSTEISRSIKNGNMDKGNAFKFIERTAAVENHKGIGVEDGLIRVEFQFEKPMLLWNTWNNNDVCDSGNIWFVGTPRLGGEYCGAIASSCLRSAKGSASFSANSISSQQIGSLQSTKSDFINNVSTNDAGITVPGSISDQKFTKVSSFTTEIEKHVIVLKLLGETAAGKHIVVPVTVKTKPVCVTCARINKASSKFCTECGTALEIVA